MMRNKMFLVLPTDLFCLFTDTSRQTSQTADHFAVEYQRWSQAYSQRNPGNIYFIV